MLISRKCPDFFSDFRLAFAPMQNSDSRGELLLYLPNGSFWFNRQGT